MRPHARTLFALAGVAALGVTAWLDRDMFLAPFLTAAAEAPGEEPPPRDPALAALTAAVGPWRAAADAFQREVESIAPSTPEGWARYHERRDRAWPALRSALERALVDLEAARALDPDDGAADVLAGFALLDLAVWPARCSGEARFLSSSRHHDDPAARRRLVQVRDTARLAEALDRLERGLARPRLRLSSPPGEPDDPAEGQGLVRLERRLVGHTPASVASLLSLRDGAEALVLIGHRLALTPEVASPARPLRAARRLGLRLAGEARTLLDLMIGQAVVHTADRGWVFSAAEEGDGGLAVAIDHERLMLERAFKEDQTLHGVAIDRMGQLDAAFVPGGGWSPERWDASLGRRMEQATAEAAALWLLLGAAALGLVVALALARREPPPAGAAGWTLGDLLGLVLGSFGAGAALVLALARLHPARAWGDLGALMIHLLAAVVITVLAARVLLRRATLERHGLAPAAPARARVGAWLLGLGLVVATGWVGPDGDDLFLLALALIIAGAAGCAWALRLSGLPADVRAAVRAYERRVAVSALGLSVVLVAAIDIALVRGRRLALADAYGDQVMRVAADEAASWGGGALVAMHRTLLRHAPDAPDLAAFRAGGR
ncbi:MAG: hypothetical protein M9894_21675 [Planctomycetes bacterium]|nr:hypothetical protein [Planctomycetota bacterium]